MISVIVYGRNDDHGYNLHKRAAISLNSLSELLDDKTDEILFIDYNTPDTLPTFLESIGDTLSTRAKQLIKIIRVRPYFHRRLFATKTHLAVVEPIARNIGLRRTSSENRWVLSTNTDMVFVPNDASLSLSKICAFLEDGFFQLPRFELPEAVWDSFDRTNGLAVIEKTRTLAPRLHLDEIVENKFSLFDAPGDFQLALRRDLFGMFGFDEAMFLGWHVDANLTARMKIKWGEILSLHKHLRGYHCDHTRLPTVYHGAKSVENDWKVFVTGVSRPECVDQAGRWGYPGEPFEEFHLDQEDGISKYNRVIFRAIPKQQDSTYLCPQSDNPFYIQSYAVEHALPFLLDVLTTLPRNIVICCCGITSRLLSGVATGLEGLGGHPSILIPTDSPFADAKTIPSIAAIATLEECLSQADIFLFEIAIVDQDELWSEADRARLARIERLFLDAVDHEYEKVSSGRQPRYFLLINAIQNMFEERFQAHIDCTRTPLCSRVRVGTIRQIGFGSPHDKDPIRALIKGRMNRHLIPPMTELTSLKRLVTIWSEASDESQARRVLETFHAPLVAYAPFYDGIRTEYIALSKALESFRPVRCVEIDADAHSSFSKGGGLLDLYDWEDPKWFRFARRFFGGSDTADWFRRSPSIWERTSILRLMELHDVLGADRKVLICTRQADQLASLIAQFSTTFFGRLDVNARMPAVKPPTSWFDIFQLYDPSRLMEWDQEVAPLLDAIVVPHRALCFPGVNLLEIFLRDCCPLIRPGGVIIFSALIAIDLDRVPEQRTATDLLGVGINDRRGGLPGYHIAMPIRLSLLSSTLERRQEFSIGDRRAYKLLDLNGSTALVRGVFAIIREGSS